jgi:lipid-A-disaccharide synthase
MMVLFPFELEFYRDHGVDAVHVGHPLVDAVPILPELGKAGSTAVDVGAPEQDGGVVSVAAVRLGLMPGSRPSEVSALLPGFLEAAVMLRRLLAAEGRGSSAGELEVVVVQAPTLDDDFVEGFVGRYRDDGSLELRVVKEDRFREIQDLDLVLCASGTATLELALLGVPMIVAYRMSPLTYALARRLVKVDHIALVNLVLEERVVPEMIQHEAKPESLSRETLRLLKQPDALRAMRNRLLDVRPALGQSGASRRVASEVLAFLRDNIEPGRSEGVP